MHIELWSQKSAYMARQHIIFANILKISAKSHFSWQFVEGNWLSSIFLSLVW